MTRLLTLTGTRGAEWEKATGTRSFPIKAEVPTCAALEGHDLALVFFVDWDALDDRARARIVLHLANRFHSTLRLVRRDIESRGLPLRADTDCEVTRDGEPFDWRSVRRERSKTVAAGIDLRLFT